MIRLMALVPLLTAGGFADSPLTAGNWTEFQTLTDAQRETLRDRHGLWVRVHPHDYGELEKLGLDFERDAEDRPSHQAPLREIPAPAPATPPATDTPVPPIIGEDTTTNTKTPVSDDTGKSKRKDR